MEVLAARFLLASPATRLAPVELDLRLRALHAAGRAAWPEIAAADLPAERFAAHLGACANAVADPDAWLLAAPAADLYLACACALGLPRAVALFEERLLSQLPTWLARLQLPPATLAEVQQQVRAKLFVAEAGKAPKIAEYTGEGALGGFLRVVGNRTALSLLRKRGDAPLDDAAADEAALAEPDDPELRFIKQRYRSEFAAAFRDALAAQSSESRNLLRLHFIDGLSIDKLGALFGVHRATAARWLQAAREGVFDESRKLLRQRLRVPEGELDSLVRLLRSQLDLSLSGALRSRAEPDPER